MKYQSEIIKEIIDTRGHDKSSLHYESECIESWIDEHKGSYPKLCDYQSEWLNYISENPLGEFPYETVTDVTKATINNVVPYAYKSAILKGNTLVNIVNFEKEYFKSSGIVNSRQGCTINFSTATTGKFNLGAKISTLKTDTEYLLKVKLEWENKATTNVYLLDEDNNKYMMPYTSIKDNNFSYKFTTPSSLGKTIKLGFVRTTNGGEETISASVLLIEHQEGMENWDIPYFEGMLSVKMPVLTTTGKNLFDENRRYEISHKLWFAIPFEKDSYFTFSSFDTIPYFEFYGTTTEFVDKLYGGDGVSWKPLATFSNKESGTFKKESEYNYIIIAFDKANLPNGEDFLKNLQVEQGTQATTYEPYKSNILTVNEDVTLRGIGDVKDELNLLTGELTQRIGEDGVVLSQEVVKTVDLTVVNQDGENVSLRPVEGTMHLSTSSETINPLFSGEIPVEAITQNLTSFIEE